MLGQERGKEAVMAERQESSLGQVKVFRDAHGLWGDETQASSSDCGIWFVLQSRVICFTCVNRPRAGQSGALFPECGGWGQRHWARTQVALNLAQWSLHIRKPGVLNNEMICWVPSWLTRFPCPRDGVP